MALDLYQSSTWRNAAKSKNRMLGKRKIGSYLHRPKFELYDLQNDPDELKNLSAIPAFQHELKRMQDKLKRFQEKTHDRWISKWEYE
jgi:N-sulfoglucosamine sulfohydrolase